MDDARDDLKAQEDVAIDRLGAEAQLAGKGAISASLMTTGRRACNAAQRIKDKNDIAESAAEMRALRLDPEINTSIQKDLQKFSNYIHAAIVEWMAAGWLMQAKGQTSIIAAEGNHVSFTVELTDEDRESLQGYNIIGYTPKEMADWMVMSLSHDLNGALGMCLLTTAGDAVLAQMGLVAERNGNRCRDQVRIAFLAGTGLAREEITRALTGG